MNGNFDCDEGYVEAFCCLVVPKFPVDAESINAGSTEQTPEFSTTVSREHMYVGCRVNELTLRDLVCKVLLRCWGLSVH